MTTQIELNDNERATLIGVLRRLVERDPEPLSSQRQNLQTILDRLKPHKPQSLPEDASTG
jgi:hypothetical protein